MPDVKENWLPVPGYEGLYSVSDLGNVMSMNYNKTGLLKMLQPARSGTTSYLYVHLHKNGSGKSVTVHSLVMLAFAGPRPSKHQTNHKSGIKSDNRFVNLEYCTRSENMLHAYAGGLAIPAHGETHCRAKVSLVDVIEIRKKLSEGWSQGELAKLYGVHQTAISRVNTGKRWKRALESCDA